MEKSDGLNYVYRFLNSKEEVIYVGRTNNLNKRMKQHFSEHGHLPHHCYNETTRVEYVDFENSNDMRIFEIYYITKCKPQYNSTYNYEENNSVFLVIEPKWKRVCLTENDKKDAWQNMIDNALKKHMCLR